MAAVNSLRLKSMIPNIPVVRTQPEDFTIAFLPNNIIPPTGLIKITFPITPPNPDPYDFTFLSYYCDVLGLVDASCNIVPTPSSPPYTSLYISINNFL